MNDSPAADARLGASDVVRVTAGARLHFGLLDTAAPFGGVGVMIETPATEIIVRPAKQFDCSDLFRDRIEPIVRRMQEQTDEKLPACEIEILNRPNEHWGLGSGTQLAMCVAEGLAAFCSLEIPSAELATRIADRGKRSAVGVHGYFHGGLIYEVADPAQELNPIESQLALPSQWCVALFQPASLPQQVSGDVERERFQTLGPVGQQQRQHLQAIVTDQMLPSARSGQLADFGNAVHQYNRAAGMLFASVQGGPYNGPGVTRCVESLISCGAQGVGQSSWGPTVFAWFETRQQADDFEAEIPDDIKLLAVSRGLNQPRDLQIQSPA